MCKADANDPSGEEDDNNSFEDKFEEKKQRNKSGSSDFGIIPKPKKQGLKSHYQKPGTRKSDTGSKYRIKVPQKLISN